MPGLMQWWATKSLRSPNSAARVSAIGRLASSRNEQSLTMLIDALLDECPEVRLAAARALAVRGDVKAVRPMVACLLGERDLEIRQELADAVGTFDASDVKPLLRRALEEPHLPMQKAAAWALQTICPSSLDDACRAQMAIVHADWDEVATYGNVAVKPLKRLLMEGSQRARRSAAKALGEIGSFESYKALIAVVDDKSLDVEVRKTAAWAFRSFSWQWIDDAHLAMIAVLMEDWSAAVNLGPSAVGTLVDALRNKTSRVGEGAAAALGEIATQEAMDALMRAQTDRGQDERVRAAAAKSLTKVAAGMLGYPDLKVRASAAGILSDLGWTPTNDRDRALFAIGRGDWAEVRSLGVDAYETVMGLVEQSLCGQDAVDTLLEMVQNHPQGLSIIQIRELERLRDYVLGNSAGEGVKAGTNVSCEAVRKAAKLVSDRRRLK